MTRSAWSALAVLALTLGSGRAQDAAPWSPCPSPASAWKLSVASGSLQVQTGDAQATCESLSFKAGGEPFVLSVDGKQVHVDAGLGARLDGVYVKGNADRVTRTGAGGAVLVMEGHVKVCYGRQGQHAEVMAERVVVNLATGHVETDIDGGKGYPAWLTPPAAGEKAVRASSLEESTWESFLKTSWPSAPRLPNPPLHHNLGDFPQVLNSRCF